MDAHILKANKKVFMEDPDLDDLVDHYFTKQEKCQRIAKTSKSQISDEGMVTQIFEHMGKTGILARSTLKFGKQLDENKTWPKAKEWFRKALDDIEEMEKFSGVDKELLANAVVHNNEKAAQEARDDIANGMSKYFGMLAQAAVAKSETLDLNAFPTCWSIN